MLSTPELIIIFLIIMLVYGGTRLPAMGRGLGQGVREFREGLRGEAQAKTSHVDDPHEAPHAGSKADRNTPA